MRFPKVTVTKRAPFFDLTCGAAALGVLLFGIPYAGGYLGGRVTLAHSLRSLWGYEQWQHCWLVLPAVGVILYFQRQRLAGLTAQGTLWGLAFLVLACGIYWAGYRVENYYLGFLSLHLMVGGLILWLGGWKWLRALAFAYAFLIFVWPLYFLENSITFPLRMVMANASAAVLNLLGVPAVVNGTGIVSAPEPLLGLRAGERFRVDVADPCSGIRSLFALMMIAALYAHFMLKTWWQKAILFAASIPLAMLGNLVRILMLTFGIMTLGPEIAIGTDPLQEPSWFH
ncbi:MAG TPA: exosortase/archaeosortase family protein, partial [Terrimicrobiaceae bacterium]|nr:exosortase/archaeosortase family protein [Terrimicrobiaceae bacterium]